MFPAQTSLIPATVAIVKFLETNGLRAFLGNYPFWYLGVPTRFLAGPIVPIALLFIRKLIPTVSLFSISIYSILLSFLVAAVGWVWLICKLRKAEFKIFSFSIGHLAFVILLILPWRYFSSLALLETSAVVSRNLLPFALIGFYNFYKNKSRKNQIIATLTLAFLLLINTTILAIFAVGVAALIMSVSFRKGKLRKLTKYVKPTLYIIFASLILVSFWYTPKYWMVVLTNPSIGGAAGFKVILRIFDLLRAAVPLVLAISAVYFSGKIKSRFSVFALTWTFTFLFLSVFRFIGDPDFWQDWTTWLFELEIGAALIASGVITNTWRARKFQVSSLKSQKKSESFSIGHLALVIVFLVLPFLLTYHVYGLLNKPKLISNQIPQGVRSLEKLNELAAGGSTELTTPRVFLSGSTVFWAGSTYSPLFQVRGGADKAATHPYWDHAAYQLREGSDPELAEGWLEALGVKYVLVHGPGSSEAYHDFKNIYKWQKVGEVVWEGAGDAIVELPDASLAWVVDLDKLRDAKHPESGIDLESLDSYLAAKKRPIEAAWINPNEILVETGSLGGAEGVVLAVTYDLRWKTEENVLLKKDPVGNIFIIPENFRGSSIRLQYK